MEIDLPGGEKHIVSSKTLTPEFMRSFRDEAERLAAEREDPSLGTMGVNDSVDFVRLAVAPHSSSLP